MFIGVRWVPDSDCDQCTQCNSLFTMLRRRHHCRNCGRIFCGRCSNNELSIPELGYDKKVRVCNLCFHYRQSPLNGGTTISTSSSINQFLSTNLSTNINTTSSLPNVPSVSRSINENNLMAATTTGFSMPYLSTMETSTTQHHSTQSHRSRSSDVF